MTLTRRSLVLGALASTTGLGIGAAVGCSDDDDAAAGGGEVISSADIGFCSDMSAHHVQALAMCQRVLGRDTGDAVQAAAAEVLQNQAMEVGQMRAWLADWGASTQPPDLVMAWMADHEDHGGGIGIHGVSIDEMPGYASDAEMAELAVLEGLAQGRRWLELMRAHHVGGVAMAEAAAELARQEKVRRLAAAQAEVQTFEISQYDQLLAGTYADV